MTELLTAFSKTMTWEQIFVLYRISVVDDVNINCAHYSNVPHPSKGKILMLGPLPPTVGGITSFIEDISESELVSKYRLTLFGTERPTVGLGREVEDYSLMFHIGPTRLAKSAIMTISHILKFPLVLITNRPDIVHINTASYWSFWENSVYVSVSKLFRKKVIIHIHGGLFDKFYDTSNIIAKCLIRKVVDTSDKIIVLSSKWKTVLTSVASVQAHPGKRIVTIENFVNSSRFTHFDREYASGDILNVLFVGGAGAKTKGVYEVLKAIPLVVEKHRKIQFYFVACGNIDKFNMANVQKYISHVKFFDYVSGDRKIEIFANSDIFVLPSYSEGLPITILEAMAAGLPIIATPVGSIPEVIEEGKNGFLVKVGDFRALADKILILAKDKKLRLRMATNNIEKIKRHYDRSVITKKLGSLYDQMLGNCTDAADKYCVD